MAYSFDENFDTLRQSFFVFQFRFRDLPQFGRKEASTKQLSFTRELCEEFFVAYLFDTLKETTGQMKCTCVKVRNVHRHSEAAESFLYAL